MPNTNRPPVRLGCLILIVLLNFLKFCLLWPLIWLSPPTSSGTWWLFWAMMVRWYIDNISDFFFLYFRIKFLLFNFIHQSFYFLRNSDMLLHAYMYCKYPKWYFSVGAPLSHFVLQILLLYNSLLFFLMKFLKRSLHQMKLSDVYFCSDVEFFTARLETKFFSGFFSHVEEQEKEIVFWYLII